MIMGESGYLPVAVRKYTAVFLINLQTSPRGSKGRVRTADGTILARLARAPPPPSTRFDTPGDMTSSPPSSARDIESRSPLGRDAGTLARVSNVPRGSHKLAFGRPGDSRVALAMALFCASASATVASPERSVLCAGFAYSCAIRDDGSLVCWGDNYSGQLGVGSTSSVLAASGEMGDNLIPVDLGTDADGATLTAKSVSCGYRHTCAVLSDGSLKCWGDNWYGQLGLGSGLQTFGSQTGEMGDNLPAVDLGTDADGATLTANSVACAGFHTCAVLSDGSLKCWGHGSYGKLGIGSQGNIGDGPGEMGDGLPTLDLGTGTDGVALTAKSVVSSTENTCAVLSDGSVKCWGDNGYGQLGIGSTVPASTPTAVDLPLTAKSVSCGSGHTCAVLSDNSIRCWGSNLNGQLGNGFPGAIGDHDGEMGGNLYPADLGNSLTAESVSCGSGHTCAVLSDGSLKCWGLNSEGQLGIGSQANIADVPGEMGDNLPVVDLGIDADGAALTAKNVSCGSSHTCAVLSDDSVKCWGDNSQGALGISSTGNIGDFPGEMGDDLPAVDLGTDRTVFDGDSIVAEPSPPSPPPILPIERDAACAGQSHTCAIRDDSSVVCWGSNDGGQLGTGNVANVGNVEEEMGDNLRTVDLGASLTAKSISCGSFHTCAVLSDDSVKCWGTNDYGTLGLGSSAGPIGKQPGDMGDALDPIRLGTATTGVDFSVKRVSCGGDHTCVLLSDDSIKCWGLGMYGQLGLGSQRHVGVNAGDMGDNLPQVDLGIDADGSSLTAASVSCGYSHTCALLRDGSIKCWGANHDGQLGLWATDNVGNDPGEMGNNLPVVDLGTDADGVALTAKSVSCGRGHTCAVLSDDSVKCWGANDDSQLGPESQLRDMRAKRVACGHDHTCAVLIDGSLKCWGSNAKGQLGLSHTQSPVDPSMEPSVLLPVDLGTDAYGGTLTAKSVTCGSLHTCAMLSDGSLKCWGEHASGKLGIGSWSPAVGNIGDDPYEMGDQLRPVNLGTGRTVIDLETSRPRPPSPPRSDASSPSNSGASTPATSPPPPSRPNLVFDDDSGARPSEARVTLAILPAIGATLVAARGRSYLA